MILKKLKLELIHNKFRSIEKKKHLKFALVVYNQKTFANFQKKLLQLVFQLEFIQIGDNIPMCFQDSQNGIRNNDVCIQNYIYIIDN